MHLAILGKYEQAIWAIIRLAPHPSCLDIRNDDAQAPLHLAVLTRQSDIVRRLLVAGAKVSFRFFFFFLNNHWTVEIVEFFPLFSVCNTTLELAA